MKKTAISRFGDRLLTWFLQIPEKHLDCIKVSFISRKWQLPPFEKSLKPEFNVLTIFLLDWSLSVV